MANKRNSRDVLPSGEVVIGMTPPERSRFRKVFQAAKGDRSRASRIGAATRQRRTWEASEAGQARTRTISDLATNVDGSQGVDMPVGQVYHLLGFSHGEHAGPKWYDQQLPGMADPEMAPRPPRWDELSEAQKSHAIEGLRRHGTSIEQIASDIGAQIDQSFMRARQAGTDTPHAMDFYEPGSFQHDKIHESAREVGLPPSIYAALHGMTSPNTQFQHTFTANSDAVKKGERQAGEVIFPNDESAKNVAIQVQMGIPASQVSNELSVSGLGKGRAQGYMTNIRKAAVSLEQFFRGLPPSEWVTKPTGEGPFDTSPKAGPYANTWASSTHPEYFVSDVHSGGGGAFPHLSSSKPVQRDEEGNIKLDEKGKPKRDKSEREKALASVPYAHAAIDHAARLALQERNLSSLRMGQAGQWGEEQIQRGEVPLSVAYPPRTPPSPSDDPTLF